LVKIYSHWLLQGKEKTVVDS